MKESEVIRSQKRCEEISDEPKLRNEIAGQKPTPIRVHVLYFQICACWCWGGLESLCQLTLILQIANPRPPAQQQRAATRKDPDPSPFRRHPRE
jgi:hypothetical protein